MKDYFTSVQHFINYINKVHSIKFALPKNKHTFEDKLKMVWARNLHNKFTWEAKKDITILKDIDKWLNKRTMVRTMNESKVSYFSNDSTREFDSLADHLKKVPGVYLFSSNDKIIYIGRSSDLGNRMLRSFVERVLKTKLNSTVYFQYVQTSTFSDAAVLELILIAEHKPVLNKATKYMDKTTSNISHKYKLSDKIIAKR